LSDFLDMLLGANQASQYRTRQCRSSADQPEAKGSVFHTCRLTSGSIAVPGDAS